MRSVKDKVITSNSGKLPSTRHKSVDKKQNTQKKEEKSLLTPTNNSKQQVGFNSRMSQFGLQPSVNLS